MGSGLRFNGDQVYLSVFIWPAWRTLGRDWSSTLLEGLAYFEEGVRFTFGRGPAYSREGLVYFEGRLVYLGEGWWNLVYSWGGGPAYISARSGSLGGGSGLRLVEGSACFSASKVRLTLGRVWPTVRNGLVYFGQGPGCICRAWVASGWVWATLGSIWLTLFGGFGPPSCFRCAGSGMLSGGTGLR